MVLVSDNSEKMPLNETYALQFSQLYTLVRR